MEGAMGAEAPMMGPDGLPIKDYLVQSIDQANLRQQLEFTGVPTSRQIWVTQENLWVYETLLFHAIANTNKERGASRPDNTAVRIIQSLEVGAPGGHGHGPGVGDPHARRRGWRRKRLAQPRSERANPPERKASTSTPCSGRPLRRR